MNETGEREVLLRATGLRKRYPNGVEAVRDLSLEVRKGEVLGLAGPNGAGKSTLLKLLAGLLRPAAGKVEACGEDVTGAPEKAARLMALMPDPLGVYTDVSSREYLEFFGRVFGLSGSALSRRVAETADALGLGPWLDAEVETLSAGWQRRLALGRALLADAPVMLLDEPAAGLDVGARADLLETVRSLAADGRTMVVSSHILPELEDLADRFAVMVDGKWAEVAPGRTFFTREELHRGFEGDAHRIVVQGGEETLAKARAALAGAGVAFEESSAAGLNEKVLEILHGGRKQ
ncbi:MAG: ABC transporter ATP-binding protein [Kiritimatiellae bacterium]|nr:ABC transporter ATP-binding protein [Kiritimatiellia bacterium]MBR1836309.1 ABC transporter ATP-binding protein [Kiritimatiellia bacterium]